MSLRFVNLRKPTTLAELTPAQRRQLQTAAGLYFGETDLPLARRLGGDDPEQQFVFLELWDVEEDGEHRYDVALYNVDSGTVFRRGKTDVVGEMVQCYFCQSGDAGFNAALQAGYRDACRAQRGERAKSRTRPAPAGAAKKAASRKPAARRTSRAS